MDRLLTAVRVGLGSAALLWAVLVVAAPWLGRSPHAAGVHVAAGTYLVGAAVCHQRPERSFHVGGVRLPVCGRCTGLYLAAALGVLVGFTVAGVRRTWRRRATEVDWRPWLLAAAVPTAVTLCAEWIGVWAPSNTARALSAAPLGAVAGALLVGLSFRSRL